MVLDETGQPAFGINYGFFDKSITYGFFGGVSGDPRDILFTTGAVKFLLSPG
jgi:hypothetical protein